MPLPVVALLAFANLTQPGQPWPRPPSSPLHQPAGRWSTASWEPCSNPCGAGEEQRQVSCVLEDVSGTLLVAADGFCAPPRPTGTRPCYQYRSECANAWVTGDWGQCSAKCGGGQRSRVVECHAGRGAEGAGAAPSGAPLAVLAVPLPDAQCVAQLRPAERRDCNLHPCPDGRRLWLRTSDDRKPRRIRLFSKFTLRCPFHVFWTPADDRSKRKYAWFKDERRLPLHEDKYTQTDNGELRVKGADETDSGIYKCASLTANPQGRSHTMTVKLERVPGEPAPTRRPLKVEEDPDDSPEDATEETSDAGPGPSAHPTVPAKVTASAKNTSLSEIPNIDEVADNSLLATAATAPAGSAVGDKSTGSAAGSTTPGLGPEQPPSEQSPAEQPPVEQPPAEQSPAEQPPVEQLPTVQPPAEQPPAEQPPAEQPPAEQLPVEQQLARRTVRRREVEAFATDAPAGDDDDDNDDSTSSSSLDGEISVPAARYDASAFSGCSAACGPAGLRQRAVRCVDSESEAQLPLAACEDLGPPPPPQEACNRVDCPPAWEWPAWTGIKCSRTCGGGAKWRQARCSQRRADGTDVTLDAAECAHLGAGEERRSCHKAPCRVTLREGGLLRLDCAVVNATWRRNGSAVNLEDAHKYLANDDTGTLLVYDAVPGDAGLYLCDEDEGGGRISTHRFDVTVLPPMPMPVRPGDDDLFIRVCNATTEASESGTVVDVPLENADVKSTVSHVAGDDDGGEEATEEPQATGPPFPWHRLFGPAAPVRSRVLGIFS